VDFLRLGNAVDFLRVRFFVVFLLRGAPPVIGMVSKVYILAIKKKQN